MLLKLTDTQYLDVWISLQSLDTTRRYSGAKSHFYASNFTKVSGYSRLGIKLFAARRDYVYNVRFRTRCYTETIRQSIQLCDL
jgi:hypothetical protein